MSRPASRPPITSPEESTPRRLTTIAPLLVEAARSLNALAFELGERMRIVDLAIEELDDRSEENVQAFAEITDLKCVAELIQALHLVNDATGPFRDDVKAYGQCVLHQHERGPASDASKAGVAAAVKVCACPTCKASRGPAIASPPGLP